MKGRTPDMGGVYGRDAVHFQVTTNPCGSRWGGAQNKRAVEPGSFHQYSWTIWHETHTIRHVNHVLTPKLIQKDEQKDKLIQICPDFEASCQNSAEKLILPPSPKRFGTLARGHRKAEGTRLFGPSHDGPAQ